MGPCARALQAIYWGPGQEKATWTMITIPTCTPPPWVLHDGILYSYFRGTVAAKWRDRMPVNRQVGGWVKKAPTR